VSFISINSCARILLIVLILQCQDAQTRRTFSQNFVEIFSNMISLYQIDNFKLLFLFMNHTTCQPATQKYAKILLNLSNTPRKNWRARRFGCRALAVVPRMGECRWCRAEILAALPELLHDAPQNSCIDRRSWLNTQAPSENRANWKLDFFFNFHDCIITQCPRENWTII